MAILRLGDTAPDFTQDSTQTRFPSTSGRVIPG